MIDKLEDTLKGGYAGLVGEVVEQDTYKLKQLKFVPEIIFDFGSNVGVFTRFARELFPLAKIVAIEPDKENCEVFRKFTNDENIILIEKAIGIGKIWSCEQDINGAHASYLSAGLGYPFEVGTPIPKIVETNIECIMPDELIKQYVKDGEKFIVKCDVEGNENIIFTHEPSMQALRKADYFTMEVHWNSLFGGEMQDKVHQKTFEACASFIPTHNCRLINTMFYAIKV